jgi:thiamine-phosphate pyrophosphorylase
MTLAPPPPGEQWDLRSRRLYLCTPDRPDLETFLDACIRGGVDLVQLRDKDLSARGLVARARKAREVCRHYGVPFILNDRPDLALEAEADGVHVGQDDAPASLARRILGDKALVGLSTHAPAELQASLDEPVDYISAGPVSSTPTKPGRPGTGLSYVAEATRTSPRPVYVTGGVSPDSVAAMARAGARHFVVVRFLVLSSEPFADAKLLRQAIEHALEQSAPNA